MHMARLRSRSSQPRWSGQILTVSPDFAPAIRRHSQTRRGQQIKKRTSMRMPNAGDAHVPRPLPPAAHMLGCIGLLVGAGLVDLFLLYKQPGMSMSAGLYHNDLGQWIIWLLACRLVPVIAACAGALILWRMSRTAARQHEQTQIVLRPLLAQAPPTPATPPVYLKPLLQSLHLDRHTQLIAYEVPVALCYGLLRPRLLISTAVVHRLSP